MAAVLTRKWHNLFVSSIKALPFMLRFVSSRAKPSSRASSSHLLWSSEVNSFGELSIFGGIESVDLHVKPASLYTWKKGQEHVAAYLVSDSLDTERVIEGKLKHILECVVSTESDEPEYSIIKMNVNSGDIDNEWISSLLNTSKLLIEVPHFFNLDIKWATSSRLTMEKLEGRIRVQAVGDCILSHLKSPSINISTSCGSITGQSSLIGDTVLVTGKDGDIDIDKIQGSNIKIDCSNGSVRIKSLYGRDTVINTASGEIHVGDAHGNIHLRSSSGDVTVESICGLLTAVLSQGNLDAKVTTGGNIDATCSNGNTTIKIDDNLQCDLDLLAKTMDISSDFNLIPGDHTHRNVDDLVSVRGQFKGLGEHRIRVDCPNGDVKLLRESWFVLPSCT